MIFKKIKATRVKSKKDHALDLLSYVLRRDDGQDEPVHAFSCVASDISTSLSISQMVAYACSCARSKNPVSHYIVSWSRGERPDFDQCDEAARLVVEELGAEICPRVWVAHEDTDNFHLHLVICRVNPLTLRSVEFSKGFDVKAGRRAVAEIEILQGWRRTINRVSRSARNEVVIDTRRNSKVAEKTRILRFVKSSINASNSWQQLQVILLSRGVRLVRQKSGLVIKVGGIELRLSRLGAAYSYKTLVSNFGKWVEYEESFRVIESIEESFQEELPVTEPCFRPQSLSVAPGGLAELPIAHEYGLVQHPGRYDWYSYRGESRPRIVDMRSFILVPGWPDDRVTEFSLIMAYQRWGAVEVSGPPAFLAMCRELAQEMKIPLRIGSSRPVVNGEDNEYSS